MGQYRSALRNRLGGNCRNASSGPSGVLDKAARSQCSLRKRIVGLRPGMRGYEACEPCKPRHIGLGFDERGANVEHDADCGLRVQLLHSWSNRFEQGEDLGGSTDKLSRARTIVRRDPVYFCEDLF